MLAFIQPQFLAPLAPYTSSHSWALAWSPMCIPTLHHPTHPRTHNPTHHGTHPELSRSLIETLPKPLGTLTPGQVLHHWPTFCCLLRWLGEYFMSLTSSLWAHLGQRGKWETLFLTPQTSWDLLFSSFPIPNHSGSHPTPYTTCPTNGFTCFTCIALPPEISLLTHLTFMSFYKSTERWSNLCTVTQLDSNKL